MTGQPLEIFVKKGVGGSDTVDNTPTEQAIKPEEEKGETSKLGKVVAAQVVNIAKQGMMMAVRNYGAITGRAREQQEMENVISIAMAGATLAVAGPVVGGIVIGAQAGLSLAQSVVTQNLTYRQIEYNNAKLGGIIKNGNR